MARSRGWNHPPPFDVSSGISMTLLQSKDGIQYFTFEHGRDYQQVQFKFLDAVESMDPNNIVVKQPAHTLSLLFGVSALRLMIVYDI